MCRANRRQLLLLRRMLPEINAPARMWIAFPETDRFQTVDVLWVDVPGTLRIVEDEAHGNRILVLDLGPEDSGKTAELRCAVTRHEKSAYAAPPPDPLYLETDSSENARFEQIAREATTGKEQDLVKARALYDHVIDSFRYQKYGEGWGRGDAVYACNARTGNCSDFHAYFIALARSIGIPARFAIGTGIPSERDDGGVDGYHCWVEFYADGKWWPVDISEGDKYSALSTYYFGHHPANRFEFSRVRDLRVDPLPASGRRWQQHGVRKVTLINKVMILGYHLGIAPEKLVRIYRGSRDARAAKKPLREPCTRRG